jgi:DNA-binding winged helix-turn-helix (wHTH) protein
MVNRRTQVAEKPKCFQIGRWQVEPDAGSMSDGRETVQVPPRLLRLLQILVEGAGDTVSREELIEALWPRGYVNEEALSRAVNELRGLLGDDARTPEFIRTIPKKGYRLIANVGTVSERKKPPHHLGCASARRCVVHSETSDIRSRHGVAS